MTLEHIGIAVENADATVAVFEALLGTAPYKSETVEREGVRTLFFGDGGRAGAAPKLELLEALSPESPVARFLDKRGPGLHHVAFSVDDLSGAMARLDALGFRLLAHTPRPGADGKRIVFLHPKSTAGVLVELCEAAPHEIVHVPFGNASFQAAVSGPSETSPLVLLHAEDDPASSLARRLAGYFRVYALTWAEPDALLALLDTAGLSAAVACDATDSGTALQCAATHPGRFTRLAVRAPKTKVSLPPHPTLVFGDDVRASAERAVAFYAALPDGALAVLPDTADVLLADAVARHLQRQSLA